MKKPRTHFEPQSLDWEPKYPFDLVIAYQDQETRDRGMLLYDRLAQQLNDDYDFQCAWWKFNHFQEASLMEQAVDDAIAANMIILSVYDSRPLPALANAWMQAWVPGKIGNKSALVALLNMSGNRAGQSYPLHSFLQQAARRARMDFFLHAADPRTEAEEYSEHSIYSRAQTVTPLLENILHSSPPILQVVEK